MVFLFFLYFLSILLWQTVGMCASVSLCVYVYAYDISEIVLFFHFVSFQPMSSDVYCLCTCCPSSTFSIISSLVIVLCSLVFSLCEYVSVCKARGFLWDFVLLFFLQSALVVLAYLFVFVMFLLVLNMYVYLCMYVYMRLFF